MSSPIERVSVLEQENEKLKEENQKMKAILRDYIVENQKYKTEQNKIFQVIRKHTDDVIEKCFENGLDNGCECGDDTCMMQQTKWLDDKLKREDRDICDLIEHTNKMNQVWVDDLIEKWEEMALIRRFMSMTTMEMGVRAMKAIHISLETSGREVMSIVHSDEQQDKELAFNICKTTEIMHKIGRFDQKNYKPIMPDDLRKLIEFDRLHGNSQFPIHPQPICDLFGLLGDEE